MPTVAAIALETLLEPGSSSSAVLDRPSLERREQKPIFLSRQKRGESNSSSAAKRSGNIAQEDKPRAKSRTNGYYISPQLYATPEPTLIVPTGGISSSSPTSVSSPSPYVVNHKRRDVPRRPLPLPENGNPSSQEPARELANGSSRSFSEKRGEAESVGDTEKSLSVNVEDDMDDGFFDPRDGMSSVSFSDTEDGTGVFRRCGSARCHTPLSGQSEFYDANEDFLSESSSFRANLEADLRALKLNLFEEMERRSKAEEALERTQGVLQTVGRLVSGSAHIDVDSAAQFCQEILFTRMVSEAIETDLAQAQTREIARLHDRLQYYEAVNQEMSQRNQEAIELSRRRRQMKKARRKWLMGCIGVAVTVGTSLLAYSYLAAAHGGPAESSVRNSTESPSAE